MQRRHLKIGTRLGRSLTVLGMVDPAGPDPVYLVWHHDAWCPMACKVFRNRRRAQREADRLRRLDHPNIVRCLGLEAPGCLLMEFLEGPTLRTHMRAQRDQKLPLGDALRVAIYIGSALVHMHARGLLHLDIKPANVIVYRGRPVLFDVGTAIDRTQARLLHAVGTDEYMAPEQCTRGSVTAAADVFGLGVTLYEILSGHLPFAKGTQRQPFPQLCNLPTPLRRCRPRAPAELETLLGNCLAYNPIQRPPLTKVLTTLHGFIRNGPAMWPADFDPAAPVNLGHYSSLGCRRS